MMPVLRQGADSAGTELAARARGPEAPEAPQLGAQSPSLKRMLRGHNEDPFTLSLKIRARNTSPGHDSHFALAAASGSAISSPAAE